MADQQEDIFASAPAGNSITPAIVSGLPMQGPTNQHELEALVNRAELSVDLMVRVKRAAIKLTNESDWCFQGDTLFPEVSAATKIAQQFGVSVLPAGTTTRYRLEDDEGPYIIVSIPLVAKWMNAEIVEIGTCSTRDRLLGTRGGGYKPLSEVDLTNVERKAQASGIRRAIIRVMGLKFTEEELTAAGLNVQKIRDERGVNFGSGTRGGNTDNEETIERKNKVQVLLIKMFGQDKWADKLEEYTAFKKGDETIKGKRQMRYVSEKQLPYLERRVNDEYKKWSDHFGIDPETGEKHNAGGGQ